VIRASRSALSGWVQRSRSSHGSAARPRRAPTRRVRRDR
jgi:hypothetical protein